MKHDNITAACDMPLLNHNLLKRMVELAQIYDAVVPRVQGKIDPLHAIYSKNRSGQPVSLLPNPPSG